MGFFSSIKRLWSSNKTEATPQTPQAPAEEAQTASQPTETEGGTSPETPPAPDTPQPPAVSETLPETASAGPQQDAQEADQPAAGQSFEPDGAPAHAPMTAEPDASPAPVAARTAKDGLPEASTSASAAHAAEGGLPEAPAPVAQPAPQPYAPVESSGWRATLLLALREAEPRLSVWLSIVLKDLGPDARTGDELWERVRFLLTALGAPENEADAFVSDFAAWAERMEYEEVADFRSELQYRLALSLIHI